MSSIPPSTPGAPIGSTGPSLPGKDPKKTARTFSKTDPGEQAYMEKVLALMTNSMNQKEVAAGFLITPQGYYSIGAMYQGIDVNNPSERLETALLAAQMFYRAHGAKGKLDLGSGGKITSSGVQLNEPDKSKQKDKSKKASTTSGLRAHDTGTEKTEDLWKRISLCTAGIELSIGTPAAAASGGDPELQRLYKQREELYREITIHGQPGEGRNHRLEAKRTELQERLAELNANIGIRLEDLRNEGGRGDYRFSMGGIPITGRGGAGMGSGSISGGTSSTRSISPRSTSPLLSPPETPLVGDAKAEELSAKVEEVADGTASPPTTGGGGEANRIPSADVYGSVDLDDEF